MITSETYRIPTIEIDNRENLISFFLQHIPICVFEHIEEISNPVGLQWNYTLTAKVSSDDIGVVIVRYKESLYEKPPDGTIALWLKDAVPDIEFWYKGILTP